MTTSKAKKILTPVLLTAAFTLSGCGQAIEDFEDWLEAAQRGSRSDSEYNSGDNKLSYPPYSPVPHICIDKKNDTINCPDIR
jgi:hypothetical protein